MHRRRQLVWFYLRPTLHAVLTELAERHRHALEREVIAILEAAILPHSPRPPNGREYLHVLPLTATHQLDGERVSA
jgi:hypothetical protein